MVKIGHAIPDIVRRLASDSLYRNSFYLLVNLGVTALSGFLFVVLCTRLYSPRMFGYATALVSAANLIMSLANIGMNRTAVRFLGKSNTKSQDITTQLCLVGALALLISFGVSFFLHDLAIPDSNVLTACIFMLAAVSLSLKNLLDNVFVAVRAAYGTLLENTLFSLVRLLVPIAFVSFGFMGIFGAQMLAALVAVIISLLLLWHSHKLHFAFPYPRSLQGKWRFALGSYTSDLIGGLPASSLPILVVAKFGPVDGALWYIVMQIINLLLMISSSINQAMFAEMAHANEQVVEFIKKALLAMYGLLVPLAGMIIILAPVVLNIFNHQYEAAIGLLRLMSLFALLGVLNYITGSILSLHKRVSYLTFVNVVNALIVIGYGLWFAHDLAGIAVGWMFGEVANLLLFAGGAFYFTGRQPLKTAPAASEQV